MRATKKERSGLQSACDELIDKAAIYHRRIVGCMRPELGEFIQSSWAGRPAIAPSCRGPSMMLPDPRSLPHGLTHWVIVAQQSDRHDTWSTTGTIWGRSCANSGRCKPLCRRAVVRGEPEFFLLARAAVGRARSQKSRALLDRSRRPAARQHGEPRIHRFKAASAGDRADA